MGIKGIYGEIGDGQRVALAKLAIDTFRSKDRSLRIAIDVSIWLFQIQAGKGGSNPALRTFYYRLVRLLRYGITPIFVFDGPDKPPFKRNAPTTSICHPDPAKQKAKRLIELFGYQHHTAPGEAEAECAALQQLGAVDMVLSEDVDTLAFGCTRLIRNWSAETTHGTSAPTHVNVLEASRIKNGKSELDREGMILVALMSGSDYIPAGIPRCGIKLACEAARAGFGHDLCNIERNNSDSLDSWKERLCTELVTNGSGYFRTKHKSLKVPDSFPDMTILGYHTSPVVSRREILTLVENKLQHDQHVDIRGLRDFVDQEFGWKHLSGAKKFLRQICPSILAWKLRGLAGCKDVSVDLEVQTEREERLVLAILGRREHFDVDGTPELKVAYIPALIVDLELDRESLTGEDVPQLSFSDDEITHSLGEKKVTYAKSSVNRSTISQWDPWEPDKDWILEDIVAIGAPLSLGRWKSSAMEPAAIEPKRSRQRQTKPSGMKKGAIEAYVKVIKPNTTTLKDIEPIARNTYPASQQASAIYESVKVDTRPVLTQPSQGMILKDRICNKNKAKEKDMTKCQIPSPNSEPTNKNINPWSLSRRSHLREKLADNILSPINANREDTLS